MKELKKGSKGTEVRKLHESLNSALKPSPKLNAKGIFDAETEESVKKFQKQQRLKVNGIACKKTLAALSCGPKLGAAGLQKPPDGHKTRNTFVGPKVQENPMATGIINKIYPYFSKKYVVISAYLSPSDLYWKINWHWDLMRVWLEYAKVHKAMTGDEKKQLEAFYKTLMSNKPSIIGHFEMDKIGLPKDTSDEKKFQQRYAMLRQLKKDLTAYAANHKFQDKDMKYKKRLSMAQNYVNPPAVSTHQTGWALDIEGNVSEIRRIAIQLGASFTRPEPPHCHCEFKGGKVTLPK